MPVLRFGDWDKVRKILSSGSKMIADASKKSLLQEGHYLRGRMVTGIRDQAPGGKRFKPLSPLTLAARRLKGFRGTKALMVRGDLRNSIAVHSRGIAVFVGILRTARTVDGKDLINVAEVHEWGAVVVLKLTPRMRRFLGVLMKEAHGGEGQDIPRPFWLLKGSGKRTIVIRVVPRPFVRPTFEAHGRPADVKRRLEERMAKLLKGSFAK